MHMIRILDTISIFGLIGLIIIFFILAQRLLYTFYIAGNILIMSWFWVTVGRSILYEKDLTIHYQNLGYFWVGIFLSFMLLRNLSQLLIKKSTEQDRFYGIVEIAEDGIIIINRSQEVVFFNRGAEKIFGFEFEQIRGKTIDHLLPSRYSPSHFGLVEQFAIGDSTSRLMAERRTVYGRRANGEEFPAQVSIARFHSNNQIYLTAIVRDVTVQKNYEDQILNLNRELEDRVIQRTKELEESNRQLLVQNQENEMFVYSVSHDLRSPLVNLEGFSNELLRSCETLKKYLDFPNFVEKKEEIQHLIEADMVESIHYIETGVARLSRIIDALLRLSRAGRVVYQLQWLSVQKIVQAVVDSLHTTIEQKKAKVQFADLPEVWGDSMAIEQLFANLIGNALNYNDPTRPLVISITSNINEAKQRIEFTVQDNGLGISEKYQSQLFQAFRRLHPTICSGEGIGLVIVRRVIERHQGEISFTSIENKGTSFHFWLPIPEPQSEDGEDYRSDDRISQEKGEN